mgnify:CR=1 FL=1
MCCFPVRSCTGTEALLIANKLISQPDCIDIVHTLWLG